MSPCSAKQLDALSRRLVSGRRFGLLLISKTALIGAQLSLKENFYCPCPGSHIMSLQLFCSGGLGTACRQQHVFVQPVQGTRHVSKTSSRVSFDK